MRSLRSFASLAAAFAVATAAATAQPDTVPNVPPGAAPAADGALEYPSLLVGGDAPKLTVASWIRGTPLTSLERGRIYVIEFWATWCAPCRKSIPHLSELQTRLKDRVTIIGVSSQEPEADVQAFVKRSADTIGYTIAWDSDGKTDNNWMRAARQTGIPTAFIVDADGKVAWIGHPLDGLDAALDRLIAGTFDLPAEAARYRERITLNIQATPLRTAFRRQLDSGDNEAALATADQILALNPAHFAEFAFAKYMILAVNLKAPERAAAVGSELVNSTLKDNPTLLKRLTWEILENRSIDQRDLPLARKAADRAVELTGHKDSGALAALARVHFEAKESPKALELLDQAIAVETDKAAIAELTKRRNDYKKRSR